jgi:TrmH family RNA methyltransferase
MKKIKQDYPLKYLRRLTSHTGRRKEGKFILEGTRAVEEALAADWPVEAILYTRQTAGSERIQRILTKAKTRQVNLREISPVLCRRLADTETPSGIMALVKRSDYQLKNIFRNQPSLLVLVDGIQDPGNLGTIIRSSDAAGAQGVIITKGTVDLYNPKVIRATMGSFFHLPVVMVSTLEELRDFMATFNLQLVAGQQKVPKLINEVNLTLPTVLAVGNEAHGLSPEILNLAQHTVSIPMPGKAESLNAAIAVSIMLYETIRQRY